MSEVWKDIEEYEELYQISNYGRVKSLRYRGGCKERILKPVEHNGYQHVFLFKNGILNNKRVHRLVAQAFIPNPDNLPQVNHKNEIKDDNRVDNLEWCSAKYNTNYGTGNQRRAEKQINSKRSKPVYQYSLDGELIKEWESTHEVQRQLGYYNNNISVCCNGKKKTAYGYIWRYA